jgi:hypothetical protein
MTYQHAKERCAAYQENGYPAGRWRLPTVAEIDFLIKMSEKNRIPSLFGPTRTQAYWAAGAYAYFGQNSAVTGIYALDFSSTGDKSAQTDAGVTRNYNVSQLASSNSGNYRFSYSGSTVSAQVFTRCVYDIWYWGEDPVAEGTAAESWLGYKLQ